MFEQAGESDDLRVLGGAWGRVRHPGQTSGQVAGDLEVEAGVVVFSGVQAGLVLPVPAGHEGAVDDDEGAVDDEGSGRGPGLQRWG